MTATTRDPSPSQQRAHLAAIGHVPRDSFLTCKYSQPCALAAALLLCLPPLASAQQSAAPPAIVAPNPEQQGLPLNWRLEAPPQRLPQATTAQVGPALADQVLPSSIKQIDLRTPRFNDEIQALLLPFMNQSNISGRALEQVRGEIWSLFRQQGSLTQIEITAVGQSADKGGSVLQVRVAEMRVRTVQVRQEGAGAVNPTVLTEILAGAKAEFAEGEVFNIDRLDSHIKRRLFLNDVSQHAVLVPAGDGAIDLQLLVSAIPAASPEWVAQYDNYGSQTYGRNRFTGGVAVRTDFTPGDRLSLLGTMAPGMNFGRAAYELPLRSLGARLAAWTSYVDYHAPGGEAGNVVQFGLGLTYPLYFGPSAVWTGYLDFADSRQRDQIGSGIEVGDKRSDSLQAKVDADLLLGPAQSAHLSLALRQGQLDLSALPSALAQDQLSTRSDGAFTKLNWSAAWSGALGASGLFDARAEIKGQLSNKNLTQSEKFALGGPSGVRAYGSSEALGDEGYVTNLELGYRPQPALRLNGFHDFGHISLYRNPWIETTTPQSYNLQGTGLGISYSYRALSATLVYARQVGNNPGLAANGLDADGQTDRDRWWLTLSAHF